MDIRSYLRDEQWAQVEPLLERRHSAGREQRPIACAGSSRPFSRSCGPAFKWRYLPHAFPPALAVFSPFGKWRGGGSAATACSANARSGCRRPLPSSTARAPRPRKREGYDGAKRVSGRKRQVLVDTQGNLLKATRPTSTTAEPFLKAAFPSIRHLWADTAIRGSRHGCPRPWVGPSP